MKRTVGASLVLGMALLTGCSMEGIGNLSVHEALFYGGSQQRLAWVYGTLDGKTYSVKLGDKVATLRPQLTGDALGLTGTLSVDAKATYSGVTTAIDRRVNVTRVGNQYSIQALGNVDSVFATDGGGTWFRLSGPVTAGQTVLATAATNNALRGAGDLTDAEADALGAELKGQGVLAVAVLPDETLPDAPLKIEPALDAGRHPVTGLYLQSGIVQVASAGPVTPIIAPVGSAPAQPGGSVGRQLAGGSNATASDFQVIVAQNVSVLSTLWNTAYGRQTNVPALPSLGAGRSVVGVFLGQRPTGGYSLSLASARISGGVLELTVNVSAPGQGSITTQALTSPWIATEITGSFSSVVVRDAVTGLVLR